VITEALQFGAVRADADLVHVSSRTCFVVIVLLTVSAVFPSHALAQPAVALVRGEVTDTSGGVLPGVTIVASSADGHVLSTTVTDSVGRFDMSALHAGPIKLTFELDGFEPAIRQVVVYAGGQLSLVERLKLAHMTENVVVVAKAPVDPPKPPPRYVPPPPPAIVPVAADQLEALCGPAQPGATRTPIGAIASHRYKYGRILYSKGDELVLTSGTRSGLDVGQNLVAVRYFRAKSRADAAKIAEHAAGLVQIVSTTEDSATAIVIHACDELMQGDLLVPLVQFAFARAATPASEDAARILFADDGRLLGAPQRLMVIDRGSEQGMQNGQRLTLSRRGRDGRDPSIVGEAVVVAVRSNSSTIRVESATDAIEAGDEATPRRQEDDRSSAGKSTGGHRQ